jgi:hypothetical protein
MIGSTKPGAVGMYLRHVSSNAQTSSAFAYIVVASFDVASRSRLPYLPVL